MKLTNTVNGLSPFRNGVAAPALLVNLNTQQISTPNLPFFKVLLVRLPIHLCRYWNAAQAQNDDSCLLRAEKQDPRAECSVCSKDDRLPRDWRDCARDISPRTGVDAGFSSGSGSGSREMRPFGSCGPATAGRCYLAEGGKVVSV